MKKSRVQKVILWLTYIYGGFVFLGTIFGAINDAVERVTVQVSFIGVTLIFTLWLISEMWIRKNPIDWQRKDGQMIKLDSLNVETRLAIVGTILLLLIPRVIEAHQGGIQGGRPTETANSPNNTVTVVAEQSVSPIQISLTGKWIGLIRDTTTGEEFEYQLEIYQTGNGMEGRTIVIDNNNSPDRMVANIQVIVQEETIIIDEISFVEYIAQGANYWCLAIVTLSSSEGLQSLEGYYLDKSNSEPNNQRCLRVGQGQVTLKRVR